MPASMSEVLRLLDLEQLEVNLFRGSQPETSHLVRVFGGQVAAQALMAAQRTVPDDRLVHSMHVYFILGGDPAIPIVYDVEDVRDGGSFTTRRVAARQHGEIIFYMTASFQRHETGFDHQDPMPPVPPPADCPPMVDVIGSVIGQENVAAWAEDWTAFDVRWIGDNRAPDDPHRTVQPVAQRLWFRAGSALPDDAVLHNAALAYVSDFSLLHTALLPHGTYLDAPDIMAASLDHAMWFHRPFRADQWLLYDQQTPSASGGRGFCTARVFAEDGALVASVVQEGLVRRVRPRD